MNISTLAGALATALFATALAAPAEASCRDTNTCSISQSKAKLKSGTTGGKTAIAPYRTAKAKSKPAARTKVKPKAQLARKAAAPAKSPKRKTRAAAVAAQSELRIVPAGGGGEVQGLIKAMAPAYGVPAWFALRIAHVESNYNPYARGAAGELGVFQLKCATAKGIGYRGNCSGLLDARTNVQYGLKHLSLALKSSGGNLKLAASKHNGGLGRRKLVPGYVAKVF